MKMKTMLRIICAVLAIVMCMAIVACTRKEDNVKDPDSTNASEDNNSSKDDKKDKNDKDDDKATLSKDEMFDKFLLAYDNSMKYRGAITVVSEMGQKTKTAQYDEDYSMNITLTTDGTADKRVMITERVRGEEKYVLVDKVFVVDGVHYGFDESRMNGEVEYSDYFVYDDGDESLVDFENPSLELTLPELFGGLINAESYDELCAAFEKAYPEIEGRFPAFVGSDDGIEDYKLDYDVSIAKNDDGEIELAVITVFSTTVDGESMSSKTERTYTVADEKIVDVKVNMEIIATSEDDERIMSYDVSYRFDYDFDEEYYESFEVSLPEDPSAIYPYEKGKIHPVTVVIGSCTVQHNILEGDDVDETMSNLNDILMEYYFAGARDEYGNRVAGITGFYKDEALTDEITPEITIEELFSMDKIYVDLEIDPEFAIVFDGDATEYSISKEYEIVRFDMFGGYASSMSGGRVVRAGEEMNFDFGHVEGKEFVLSVNGEKVEGFTFIPEGGRLYDIKRVTIIKDDSINVDFVTPMG